MPTGRQTFNYDCGAKALQLVFAYYGLDIREDKLMEELDCDGSYGTLAKNMVRVAQNKGFQVTAKSGFSLDEVKQYVAARCPVIVLLQAWAGRDMTLADWEKANDYGHYVVAIGYQDGKVIFADPSSFPRTWLREDELLSRWHYMDTDTHEKLDHFAMVFSGKEPVPVSRLEHMD
jgi:predicted double-glycine peptidase